jgi:hypothetical protein
MSGPSRSSFLQEIDLDLHNLCQPLTALQCRMELARLVGSREDYRVALDDSLEETGRIFEVVARMRERLVLQQFGAN